MSRIFLTIFAIITLFNNAVFTMEQPSTFNRVCIIFTNQEARNTFNAHSSFVEALGAPVFNQSYQGGVQVFKLIYNLSDNLSDNEINSLLAQTINPNLLENLDLNTSVTAVGYEQIYNE